MSPGSWIESEANANRFAWENSPISSGLMIQISAFNSPESGILPELRVMIFSSAPSLLETTKPWAFSTSWAMPSGHAITRVGLLAGISAFVVFFLSAQPEDASRHRSIIKTLSEFLCIVKLSFLKIDNHFMRCYAMM